MGREGQGMDGEGMAMLEKKWEEEEGKVGKEKEGVGLKAEMTLLNGCTVIVGCIIGTLNVCLLFLTFLCFQDLKKNRFP